MTKVFLQGQFSVPSCEMCWSMAGSLGNPSFCSTRPVCRPAEKWRSIALPREAEQHPDSTWARSLLQLLHFLSFLSMRHKTKLAGRTCFAGSGSTGSRSRPGLSLQLLSLVSPNTSACFWLAPSLLRKADSKRNPCSLRREGETAHAREADWQCPTAQGFSDATFSGGSWCTHLGAREGWVIWGPS